MATRRFLTARTRVEVVAFALLFVGTTALPAAGAPLFSVGAGCCAFVDEAAGTTGVPELAVCADVADVRKSRIKKPCMSRILLLRYLFAAAACAAAGAAGAGVAVGSRLK